MNEKGTRSHSTPTPYLKVKGNAGESSRALASVLSHFKGLAKHHPIPHQQVGSNPSSGVYEFLSGDCGPQHHEYQDFNSHSLYHILIKKALLPQRYRWQTPLHILKDNLRVGFLTRPHMKKKKKTYAQSRSFKCRARIPIRSISSSRQFKALLHGMSAKELRILSKLTGRALTRVQLFPV